MTAADYIKILCISSCILFANCHIFLRGRPAHGFVGLPNTEREWKVSELPKDQWFDQSLDHFDVTNSKTWQQRYFVNDTFYKNGGPVFLQIGGEGPANSIWLVEGQCVKYAKSFNALVVLLEHRYYGKSHPTADLSVKNLEYLSSEQALADLAFFRQFIMEKLKLPVETKWISFGGSYPGSLAAWVRLKYPHLIHASISSSAPMVAVKDFKEYLQVVKNSLATTGPTCNQEIAKATQSVEKLMKLEKGVKYLKKLFNLCHPLNVSNTKDVMNFYSTLAGNFEGVVQYNKDNRKFEGAVGTEITIDKLCSIMDNKTTGTPLQRYAKVNDLMLKTYGQSCLDYKYSSMIESMKAISWNSSASEGGRQWVYQTCTEFGFYQSSDYKDQPFGHHFPAEFYVEQCKDIYGSGFSEELLKIAIKRTNTFYGGRNISVTRVMFINGSIDPWHALGILKSLSEDVPAVLINGTAHCANMYPDSQNDPPQLRQTRKMIQAQIAEWLQQE